MQIHELVEFNGEINSDAYLAVDNGDYTGKLPTTALTDPLNARIDNIIAGPAPSQQEIIDARLGFNGEVYPSLGDSIRGQVSQTYDDVFQNIKTIAESLFNDGGAASLPATIKSYALVEISNDGDSVIAGTNNVAQLLGIKEGSFVVNGVTFKISGNTINIAGQPTTDFNYDFASGTAKTSSELSQMTLQVPEHIYTLSQKVTSGTVFPAISVRSKSSGNIVTAQNNTAVFTMDADTCGGFYAYMQASKTYSCTFVIALLPYQTDNGNPYREETSSVKVFSSSGIYYIDGYTWVAGSATVELLYEKDSEEAKRPYCKYSTRPIPYSNMTQCLDIYIPAKDGYINYIFGHTVSNTENGDVWRLVQVDSVSDSFAFNYHITQLGETEMAIMINGRSDFIGGSTHGDEIMDADSFIVVLDGKIVDITQLTQNTEFEVLQIFLVSDMFDPADHVTLVGRHGREWRFDESGLYLAQSVEFLEDLTLNNSYMPMLCVLRGNDTASAIQVSDTYIDDGNYIPYDVSVGGFTTYPNQLKPNVRDMYLLGKTSGMEANVTILEEPEGLKSEGTFVYNGANTYNKIYCCICGYGGGVNLQNVSNGDKWTVKTKINFQVG